MSKTTEIKVPDIGDFEGVEIIEVLVSTGDEIEAEQSLVTLESDKATMEVPSPAPGTLAELKVSVGDKVSEGDVIGILETDETAADERDEEIRGDDESDQGVADKGKDEEKDEDRGGDTESGNGREKGHRKRADTEAETRGRDERGPIAPAKPTGDIHVQCLVLGSGPGGYTAAFRAADLGLDTALVERYDSLGGVCLNVGCIPSKALLHAARVIDDAAHMGELGVSFGKPKIDLDRLRGWKDTVVGKLTGGLSGLARRRKVKVVQGVGRFVSPHELEVETHDGRTTISFDAAIIAAGSESAKLPGIPLDDPRVFTSTGALELRQVPNRMLVVGGGIIGLEMACVYEALGSRVTVVEMLDELMAGADQDIVRPLKKRIEKRYEAIYLETKVAGVKAQKNGLKVEFEGNNAPDPHIYDAVLVAVGRKPNGNAIGADTAGVEVNKRGFIPVDDQQRTNVAHIFAIGDIVGQPMLAHKATHEGKVAAEVIAGERSGFDARVIPSVAYTDPEVAWVGITEAEARKEGIEYGKGSFPWAASGRALGLAREEGMTKLLFDKDSGRIIGAGIVGPNAGDLIAECVLAIEMNADARDIGLTIHPHPTLSETVAFSAEAYEGTITDLYIAKKK